MKLKFLGEYNGTAAVDENKNNTNAYFIHENILYFIDCGISNYRRVIRVIEENKQVDNIFILITHMHNDHVAGISFVAPYVRNLLKRSINIVSNDEDNIKLLMKLLSIRENKYTIYSIKEFNNLKSSKNTKIFIKEYDQVHDPMCEFCYAYLITLNDKYNIYYSGDGNCLYEEILNLFYNNKIQEFYQEIGHLKAWTHIHFDELMEEFKPEYRSKIHIMHFPSDKFKKMAIEYGFSIVKAEE